MLTPSRIRQIAAAVGGQSELARLIAEEVGTPGVPNPARISDWCCGKWKPRPHYAAALERIAERAEI